jgi:hypothetical protein
MTEELKRAIKISDYDEINVPIVNHLISCVKDNPDYDVVNFLETFREELHAEHIYLDDNDIEAILIEVREKTVDEKKLIEDNIVFTADYAKQLTKSFQEEHNALIYSGLEKTKLIIMKNIKAMVMAGDDMYTEYVNDYDTFMNIIKWLKQLGYKVEIQGRNYFEVSWDE